VHIPAPTNSRNRLESVMLAYLRSDSDLVQSMILIIGLFAYGCEDTHELADFAEVAMSK